MKYFGNINKSVFSCAVIIYLIIFFFVFVMKDRASVVINGILDFILNSAGWLFIVVYILTLLIFLFLGLSKYGKIRLGEDNSRPEYSFFSWMGMLFGAGLGVGLVFYGVTEPMSHFMQAPYVESGTAEAAADAMRITFFHWSILPWSMYGMIGLCIAYFSHNKGLPELISSSFAPMLGYENTGGKIGKTVDVFSLVAIICGASMSIGFAATQFTVGLKGQYGVNDSFFVICVVTAIIGVVSIVSCLKGVSKGIKYISDINMYIVIFFLVFAFLFGNPVYLIKIVFEGIGSMLSTMPETVLFMDSYRIVEENVGYNWMGSWTIMYWAWWAAFGPFVGGFLANISKGRTVREFVLACAFVPGVLCCLWFGFFGGGAIRLELFEGANIGAAIVADTNNSLYIFLEQLPISAVTIPLAMLLIITLIVTSVNSATYVAGTFSYRGDASEPSLGIRAFWGVFIVINAIAFMAIGGLDTLKSAAIALALPFIIIVALMNINLLKDMKKTLAEREK